MTISGRIPWSMQKTPARWALPRAAALIALLAAVLFTAPPVSAQNPAVTVAFGQFEYIVEESDDTSTTDVTENQVAVTVTLSADPEREVIIPIETTEHDGATSADYSQLPTSVTFASGEREKTITFTATHDTVDDDGEYVILSFGSGLPAGVTAGATDETTVWIRDDDRPTSLTVFFTRSRGNVAEGETESVEVQLSDDPEREIVIPITVTNLGGASPADYSSLPASVTFSRRAICYEDEPANCYEDRKSFRFRLARDTEDDDGEAVRLGFGTPLPAGVTAGPRATSTVSINDGGSVTVGLAQVGVEVRAHLKDVGDRNRPLNLSNLVWQWQRSATEYGAYSDIPAPEGGTSNPYTPSAGDLGMWLKAKVTYDDATNTGLTAQATTLGTVLSKPTLSNAGHTHHNFLGWVWDQPGTHRYAQAFTTGPHAGGYLLTEVRLALFVTGESADGTWAVHADAAGKPAVAPLTAALPILNDDLDDSIATFNELTHPDGVHLEPGTKYWIVISQTTPTEDGNIGIVALSEFGGSLIAVPRSEQDMCVPLEDRIQEGVPEDSCVPPVDPGSEDGWSVDFPALAAYWDDPDSTMDDNPDTSLLPWQQFEDAFNFPPRFALRMSLVAVKVYPEVTVQFGAADYTVAEGGTQTVTVSLNVDPLRTVIIPIETEDLGGASTADYSGVPEDVTFNAGDTSKTFAFAATQDTVDDDDEGVKLTFGTISDDKVSTGTTDETTVSITDDDDPFVTVEFGASAYTVAESDVAATLNVAENEVEVTVTLSADPERTVIIPIETDDLGGASPADYSTLPTSVTFNAGDTSKSFTFTATHDTVDDDDESVKLTFGTMPDARVSGGATDETTVAITDDDHPEVTVEFGQDSYLLEEGETVNVTIKLSADPERTVTIPVTSTPQGMASAADYTVPTSVTFNDGEVEKTIAFVAEDDTHDDEDESVKLGFGSGLPARVTAGTRTETTVNIADNDLPVVTVMFSQSSYTVAEGGTQSVTVTLDKDPDRTIIMPITRTDEGTASAADYSGVPPSVTFNDGDTSVSFTFTATQDEIDDDNEKVKLGFGTMPDDRVSAGTTAELTLSITDDDTADIVISPVSLSVDEEDDSSYSVRLDTEPTVNVTVTISGHSGTDLTLEGVKLSNDILTFTAANWGTPQTVTVEAAHDDDGVADNETLTHTASGAEYAGLTKALPVTVNDNDPLGISISPLALTVDESESADYAVSLDTEPTVAVTVTISGHTGTDLTLSGSTLSSDALTFTTANWDTPQTITVSAGHDDDIGDDSETLTHTGGGGEYEGLAEGLPVLIDDNTGNLRLVGGTLTDEDGNLCEGRLEIYHNGEWGTICNDYWTENDADVACRVLGFVGGSVEDWGRFRTAVKAGFPAGAADQQIMLDDLRCGGKEANLLECTASQVGKHNCRHREDVGLRCIKNSAGPHVISLEISPAPGGNGKYDAGETVTVMVVWSEPVNVTVPLPSSSDDDIDPPHLHVAYGWPGAPTTEAVYSSGSGTARTAFTATVEDRGNAPYSRVDVYQESLSLGEGTITSVMTGNPVILGQGFYRGPEAGEQAEAVTITGVPTFNDPGEDGVFGAGEMVKVTFIFSQPVQVDTAGGIPSVEVLLSGTTGKQALYLSGSGAGQLVFGYTLAETDGEHSSLLVDPNSLALNGGAIRDVANNLDADIGHQGGGATFARPVEATAPQLQSATVDGATLTLTYDGTLDVGATPSSAAFTVNVNGSERNIIIVGLGGANVLLTLSPAVESGDTVTVDYAKPSGANVIKDTDGNEADSFTGQAVTNNTATPVMGNSDPVQAPGSLNVARHESGKLRAYWDAPASGPTPTGYTVQWKESGDDWATAADVSAANVNGPSHVITGLTDGTEYAVRVMARQGDDDSDPSADATATPQETVLPTPSSASVDGATLAITFSETLDTGQTPGTSAFGVSVAGSSRGVDTVSVSGSVVTLTLVTAVSSGEAVTVDYTAPSDESAVRLQDLVGNAAASFTAQAVTNNTAPAAPLTPPNSQATGNPEITGTAQVDQLLTATTSAIGDADGLENAAFQYQWLADDAEIADATGSTYTPVSGDVGKTIKVKVTFTDDAGHAESLVSAAVGPVVAAASSQLPEATITPGTTPVEEGEAASFTISLDRSAPAALSVAVSVSDPGGVLSGAAPTSVAFASGDSSSTITLGTQDDDVIESGSAVTVSLAAGTGYTLGDTTSASVRTTDNDVATWTVSVEPSEIEEGGRSTFTVAVANGKTFAAGRTIGLAVTGTASGSDYTLSTTELTLDEGATSVAATVAATDDTTIEGDETVIVAATHDGQAIGTATVTILANDTPPSSDATLSYLALSGIDIGAFSSETTAYSASVDYDVASTTVTAGPTDDGASVTIADANGSTRGTSRTVSLSTGDNEITVTVTAEDVATTKVYTITVARAGPAADWGERLPDRDISLGSGTSPSGMWSDGDAMWVITDPSTGRIGVYSLADGAEQAARGFTLSGSVDSASALWSNSSTLWVADLDGGAVRAYGLSDGARQADHDLDSAVLAGAGNTQPSGLWSDGATMWVADYGAKRVFAYDLASKARQESKEFDLDREPGESYNPYGIWSNGDTMLVADWIGGEILAHGLSDGQRKPNLDVSTLPSGTYFPTGIWTDGDTLWVSDDIAGTLYAYAVPGLGSTP